MSSSKEIYARMNSVALLQQVTKTMKLISVSKLMKLQNSLKSIRSFLNVILENQSKFDKLKSVYISNDLKVGDKTLIIPVGSDKGFCGAFNNNIYKSFQNFNNNKPTIMPIGKKIFSLVKKSNFRIINNNVSLLMNVKNEILQNVANNLYDSLENNTYSNIVFIYNKFFSASTQKVVCENIEIKKDTFLKNNKDADNNDNQVIYESSEENINSFFNKNIFIFKFLNVIYESMTSENAYRMVTMNKANDNANNLLKTLKILYNQSRQVAITNEIIEISAGAKVLKK